MLDIGRGRMINWVRVNQKKAHISMGSKAQHYCAGSSNTNWHSGLDSWLAGEVRRHQGLEGELVA